MRYTILFAACVAASCGAAQPPIANATENPLAGARLVDLTYAFDENTIYWPTSPSGFVLQQLSYGPTEGGYFYSAYAIQAPEHGGTHLDAPIHFAEGASTNETIPLSRLVAPAVVVDIRDAAAADPDALLTVAHLERFEAAHGRIEPGTIVLVWSGWGPRWPDRKAYLGDDTPGDASNLHFPGVSGEAAKLLVERRVAAVGIDTASIDHGPSRDFIAHRTLMKVGIPVFENVGSLDQVPARGATVVALPMKIRGGSGGPLRAIALVPDR